MDIETAREMQAAATAKEPQCTCPSRPHFGHGAECLWSRWVHTSMPAKIDIEKQAPAAWAALILAVEALEGRCEHQEMYEARNDGASVAIYPEIMHPGECGEETSCKPCGNCKALAAWRAL